LHSSPSIKRVLDILYLLGGIAILALFTTRYQMPFRLDDVLLMLWAKSHTVWDAFDPIKGQLVNSFRPMFAVTAYLLTHFAGWDHTFWWHLTLDLSLLVAIAFTGLTARYLIRRWFALEISILLYWIVFLPILNIFFWYSDLTFALELCFTSISWYFALRGLYEARLGFWFLGMLAGCLAVLSKEPAFVLVHVVIAGSFLLERHSILEKWKAIGRPNTIVALLAYAVMLGLTLWLGAVSPTRANRFFALSMPDLGHFIRDRIEYYGSIYLSLLARTLLFTPIVFAGLQVVWRIREAAVSAFTFLMQTFLALVLALLLFQNILVALPITVFVFIVLATLENPERARVRRLLPFLACLFIAMAALLITIQLVKTQLTESALLTCLLSSWAWSIWIERAGQAVRPYRSLTAFRWGIGVTLLVIIIAVVIGFYPKSVREERLLGEVRDVRQNANDAVTWVAGNLPAGSLLAVMNYQLHGIDGPGALTSQDDETKLRAQYTFDGGFFYDALAVCGRTDFRKTYLTDSTMIERVLDGMRNEPNSYLLLQSELDLRLFHGAGDKSTLAGKNDTLVVRFARGPYPTEIWHLRQ